MQLKSESLQFSICHGRSFMLPQVLAPRSQPKQFQIAFGLFRIVIETPSHRTIAQPALSQLPHHQPKPFRVFQSDKIFNGDKNGAEVEVRLKIGMCIRPVRGRTKVDRFVNN